MKNTLLKLVRLLIGFIFCASSTVFMLNSNLGLLPWDVFHQGISNITGMTIGQASIIASLIVIILGLILGQKVGIGTVLNIFIVGKFIDVINESNMIPVAANSLEGLAMLVIGIFTMAYGCFLYIGCGLGCGPRDGLMISLSDRFNMSIKIIRGIIEVSVLVIGFLLGGKVGVGTFITAIGLGYSMQIIFNIFKFEPIKIEHKSIWDTLKIR